MKAALLPMLGLLALAMAAPLGIKPELANISPITDISRVSGLHIRTLLSDDSLIAAIRVTSQEGWEEAFRAFRQKEHLFTPIPLFFGPEEGFAEARIVHWNQLRHPSQRQRSKQAKVMLGDEPLFFFSPP
jgi:hypothetical protein